MNRPKLERCPHCEGEVVVRWFYEYEALQCDNCGMIFVLPQHGCGSELHDAFNRRAPLPDNKALTVEELRGMDGQPVYIVCDPDANVEQLVMWALVEVDADGGEVYLTNNLGGRTEFLHSEDFDGMNIYRRQPEKGE